MSQPAATEAVDVDLDENTVTTPNGTHELFNDDGELRLWSGPDGWWGYRRLDDGRYAWTDARRSEDGVSRHTTRAS